MIQFVSICSSCNDEFEEDDTMCPKCILKIDRAQEPEYLQQLRGDVNAKKNIICIGAGGSGKSYILRKIAQQLQDDPTDTPKPLFDILCPTGNSAINVNGITYHTLFGWRKQGSGGGLFFNISSKVLSDPTSNENMLLGKITEPRYKSRYKRILELNTLIFDEFSMISNSHFQSMNKICQLVRKNSYPFGGIQIIMFGDPFQLRPVMGGYPFESEIWNTMNFITHELAGDKLYRFSSLEFSDMTRMIRLGIISQPILNKLSERNLEPSKKIMELYFTNKEVDISNQSEYDKINNQEYLYPSKLITRYTISNPSEKKIKLDVIRSPDNEDECVYNSCNSLESFSTYDDRKTHLNNCLQTITNKHGKQISQQLEKDSDELQKNLKKVYGENFMCIKLKPGTRVFCTINAKEDGEILYANGTTGIIKECHLDYVTLELDDGRILSIHYKIIEHTRRLTLDKEHIIDLKFNFHHIPLRLGYAASIHRSQGMTLDTVRVSGKGVRKTTGIVYVGLSRCRSLDNTYLNNLDLNKVLVSSIAIEKFNSHYIKEITHLQTVHPEWFAEYYINTDSQMAVQKMHGVITSIERQSICENMPNISSNTQSTHMATSRGSSQTELRKWLLANQKTCLVTRESIPDLLDAAHIKDYSEMKDSGIAHQNNAILLRVDIHSLFDSGMLSFENDGKIILSKSLKDHPVYSNYDKVIFPDFVNLEFVEWHHRTIFKIDK